MALAMSVARLWSRPRARFTWLLVVVVVGTCAFGGFFVHRHSTEVAGRHRADRAQQQLTSYRAPTGFTDVHTTFACFGSTGEGCFTSVSEPRRGRETTSVELRLSLLVGDHLQRGESDLQDL